MNQTEIANFFNERKESWLKKKLNASMNEDEVFECKLECERVFSPQEWLPNAASRARQISISSHPCTFSHPSSRKNNNGYVTSIVSKAQYRNDGFLRSGNVKVASDALGNAAALDVYKFLTLRMDDGLELLEHIKNDSDIAKSVLSLKGHKYEALKSGFLAMVENSSENITSLRIKQVYFPIGNDYHLLSMLSNSGIMYHLRKKLDGMRFGDDIKELREKRKKLEFSENGFMEVSHLTTMGFGGTKPQNISVLNSANGGKVHLLHSMPPNLQSRNIYFPKSNFFGETLRDWELRDTFFALEKIFKRDYNNKNIREGREYRYEEIVDKIIKKMWQAREVAHEQYYEKNSTLRVHQKIWLLDEQKRQDNDEWLEKLLKEVASWVILSYEKLIAKEKIIFGKAERQNFIEVLEKNKEAFR